MSRGRCRGYKWRMQKTSYRKVKGPHIDFEASFQEGSHPTGTSKLTNLILKTNFFKLQALDTECEQLGSELKTSVTGSLQHRSALQIMTSRLIF